MSKYIYCFYADTLPISNPAEVQRKLTKLFQYMIDKGDKIFYTNNAQYFKFYRLLTESDIQSGAYYFTYKIPERLRCEPWFPELTPFSHLRMELTKIANAKIANHKRKVHAVRD